MNISNFLDDRTLQLKMKDKLKQKPKKSLSTACQNRLYPKKEVKKSSLFDRLEQIYLKENPSEEIDINDKTLFNYWLEMSPGAKSKHKLVYSNQNEVAILLEQAYSDKTLEFCEKLEELYKKQHPDHKDFKRANIMFEFWKNLASNEISTESKTFQNAREVIRVLEKIYNDKIKSLCKLFQDRFGFEVDNCKDKNGKIIMTKQARLFKFWKNELIVEGNEGFNQSPRHSTYKKEGRKSDNSPNKSQQSFMSNYSKKAQDYKKLRKIDFECDENVIFLIDDYFRDQEYRRNIKVIYYKIKTFKI